MANKIKNILVPTDFSEYSRNAARFALEIARKNKARITCFNVIEETFPVLSEEEIEAFSNSYFNPLKNLLKGFAHSIFDGAKEDVKTDIGFSIGSAVKQIVKAAETVSADLIIMGVKGSHAIGEKLFGSVTTGVISCAEVPVMAIPENYSFTAIKKIVFACDDASELSEENIEQLNYFIKLFDAEMVTLKVFRFPELLYLGSEIKGIDKLKDGLKGTEFNYEYVVNDDVDEAILDFAKTAEGSLIIMMPKKHDLLYKTFIGSYTKQVAFKSEIPLLTLPQDEKVPLSQIS